MDRLTTKQQKIVEDNINLVHYILQNKIHLKPMSQDYEDLFQVGCLGLCKAVLKFNYDLGYKLSTYASNIIWGEIMVYKRDNRYIVKYPSSILNTKTKVLMYMTDNPDASFDMMVKDLNLSDKQIAGVLSTTSYIEDMVVYSDDGKDSDPYDYISSYDSKNLEDQLDMSMIYDNIDDCLDKLKFVNNRAKSIFTEYIYDVMYIEESGGRTTQQEYGNKYSYSQAQVARVIKQGLEQLRILLKEMGY